MTTDWRTTAARSFERKVRDADGFRMKSVRDLLGPIPERVAAAMALPPEEYEEPVACERCGDCGYVQRPGGVLALCRCDLGVRIAMQDAGVGGAEYAGMTFDAFRPGDGDQGKMLAAVRAWAAEPSGFLCLLGSRGRGKTHLAVSALRAWCARSRPARFVVVADWLDRLQATMANGAIETREQVIAPVQRAPLLVLDDYGAERDTAWRGEELFKLINHRYVQALPTVLTTNLSPGQMDERTASRLLDRRHTIVETNGPDVRVTGVRR